MNKKIRILIIAFFAVFLIVSPVRAASEVDQQFITGTTAFTLNYGHWSYQVFRPSKNILDKVAVEITGVNPSSDKVKFQIRKWNGTGWTAVKESKDTSLLEGWNTYDFGDVSVETDTRYSLFVSVASDGLPKWKYSKLGSYERGYVVANDTEQPYWDANFKTWGYNQATPPAGDGATANGNTQSSSMDSAAINNSPASQNIANSSGVPDSTSGDNTGSESENRVNNISESVSPNNNYGIFTPLVIIGLGIVAILAVILGYLLYRRKVIAKANKTSNSSETIFSNGQRGRRPDSGSDSVRSNESGKLKKQ